MSTMLLLCSEGLNLDPRPMWLLSDGCVSPSFSDHLPLKTGSQATVSHTSLPTPHFHPFLPTFTLVPIQHFPPLFPEPLWVQEGGREGLMCDCPGNAVACHLVIAGLCTPWASHALWTTQSVRIMWCLCGTSFADKDMAALSIPDLHVVDLSHCLQGGRKGC